MTKLKRLAVPYNDELMGTRAIRTREALSVKHAAYKLAVKIFSQFEKWPSTYVVYSRV